MRKEYNWCYKGLEVVKPLVQNHSLFSLKDFYFRVHLLMIAKGGKLDAS